MVLNHLLCFLLSKYHKCDAKTLKSTILSFYSSEDIHSATVLFLDILSTLQDADKLTKTTRRRDSKERSVHEVDDLIGLLSDMDEKQLLSSLPMFVSNAGEKMPSSQLTDGDMRVIMKRFEDIEREISRLGQNVNNATSAIKSNTSTNTVHTPSIVNDNSWPSVQQAAGMTASTKPRVTRQSKPVNEVVVGSWDAMTAAEQAEQASSELSSCGDEPWQTVSGKSKKRRRIQQADTDAIVECHLNDTVRRSQQQRRVIQPAVQSTNTARPAAAASAVRKRAPIVIGRMHSSDMSNIAAAKPYLAKSTFYIENLSTDVTTDNLESYIVSMGVEVLGCYAVKPRLSRWQRQHNMTTIDRKSFRVCVPREDSEQFLNPDRWPAHVAISRWIFKQRTDNQASNDNGRSSTPAATTSRASVASQVDAAAAAGVQSTPVTADVDARSSSPRGNRTVGLRSSSSSSSNSSTAAELDATMIENNGGC